jgi:predicted hydrocarbon binding protein
VFDAISAFDKGTMILVLDEGHYESLLFLNHLLTKFSKPTYLLSHQPVASNFKSFNIGAVKALSELSIRIAEIRNEVDEGILIHHYLPYILINYEENVILKFLEHLTSQVQEKPLLEFLTLPKGTFPSFEKKAQALLHGTVVLSQGAIDGNYVHKFSILKACKPEFYAKEFPYTIRGKRLLILFEDEYIDRLPSSLEDKILAKKWYLQNNVKSLKVIMSKGAIETLAPVDYFLLTQIHNLRLTDVKLLFYDRFEEILDKLSRWGVLGATSFERATEQEDVGVVSNMKRISKLALSLPCTLSSRLLGKQPRKVPIEALLGLRKSIEIVLSSYFPDKREPTEAFQATEKLIHELASRVTTIERLQKSGETPWVKLNFEQLPKAASLALYIGFGLKSKIVRKTDSSFNVVVSDCFECEGLKGDKPVCNMVSGTLVGSLCQVAKKRIKVEEVKCKAVGDKECVFLVREGVN